jgi:hypothetical protein
MTEDDEEFHGDKWAFWEDAKISCASYNAQIDLDALNVLLCIRGKMFNSTIAAKLNLPDQYVELIQSIFCSADWCEYGGSPRGCWMLPHDDIGRDARVKKFAAYVFGKWFQSISADDFAGMPEFGSFEIEELRPAYFNSVVTA